MTDEEMAEEYENVQDYCGLLDVLFEEEGNQDYGGLSYYISPYIEQAFLAGLKAGRLKWHMVADGDLPKASQKCYFIHSNTYGKDNKVIFSESSINVLTGVYSFFLDGETGEETSEPCFYDDINDEEINLKEVYAWKEIVLPKLSNGGE